MTTHYPNIDKSAFRPGQYVGYAAGAWRVVRSGTGWRAFRNTPVFICHEAHNPVLLGRTLADISGALTAWAFEHNAKYAATLEK